MRPEAKAFTCRKIFGKRSRRRSSVVCFGAGRNARRRSIGNFRMRNSESLEAIIMTENHTIHLIEIPIGGKGGFIWNRLHGEREDICDALSKDGVDERHRLLQARLRKIDDALDRLMSGSYGNCSNCGRAIGDETLDLDPALELCVDGWGSKTGIELSPSDNIIPGKKNAFKKTKITA